MTVTENANHAMKNNANDLAIPEGSNTITEPSLRVLHIQLNTGASSNIT